ncbi:MAG: Clp protease N-terminal domain-containing protein, partial [Veillonella caviae]
MMQRFTDDAQRVLSLAQDAALELGHDYVGTEHILIGLIKVKQGVAAKALQELDINTDDIIEDVIQAVGKGNKKSSSVYMTPRVKHVLELAVEVANRMNHNYVGTEHILLGLLSDGGGVAVGLLRNRNIRNNDIVDIIRNLLGSSNEGNAAGANQKQQNSDLGELADFCTDLNELAKQGKIDPVIGRENEITRVIQILSRRTKNNPVLIGEPGVGKTAIAEGLAQRIVDGNVPEVLRNKRIISLSLGAMLAGAKYRGEFEERLKKAIDEVQAHDDMIIFIDE